MGNALVDILMGGRVPAHINGLEAQVLKAITGTPASSGGPADKGRGHDSLMARIGPEDDIILRLLGGTGKANPRTGLPEYDPGDGGDGDGDGDGEGAGGDMGGEDDGGEVSAAEANAPGAVGDLGGEMSASLGDIAAAAAAAANKGTDLSGLGDPETDFASARGSHMGALTGEVTKSTDLTAPPAAPVAEKDPLSALVDFIGKIDPFGINQKAQIAQDLYDGKITQAVPQIAHEIIGIVNPIQTPFEALVNYAVVPALELLTGEKASPTPGYEDGAQPNNPSTSDSLNPLTFGVGKPQPNEITTTADLASIGLSPDAGRTDLLLQSLGLSPQAASAGLSRLPQLSLSRTALDDVMGA